MARSPVVIVLLISLSICGCGISGEGDQQEARVIDFRAQLLEADRLFAKEVAAAAPGDRSQIWAGWFTPSGRQVLPGSVVQGQVPIAELMTGAFSSPGYSLTWEPDMASVSNDGSLGWTSGRYENRREAAGDVVVHGRYLSIWRRQAGGDWKVELDTGVPDPGH